MKIGKIQINDAEAWKIYESNQYIVTYGRVYQLHYSQASGMIYGNSIYQAPGLCKRGTWQRMTAQEVNDLVGFKLLNT